MRKLDYKDNTEKVKEANEIAKMLGKNIKFKQCFIKVQVDDRGHRNTIMKGMDGEGEDNMKFKTELQIQVINYEKNITLMWSEEKFEDKLVMMRDALADFEQNKIEQERKAKEDDAKQNAVPAGSYIFNNEEEDGDLDLEREIRNAAKAAAASDSISANKS